jgi:hypothetical protein
MAGKAGYLIAILLGGLVLAAIFMPQVRQLWLNLGAQTVQVEAPDGSNVETGQSTLDLRIITVLGKDGIPAILNPQFVDAAAAMPQMGPSERVLGVSINGDHRAYPLNLLSRHEIVNDTVGGVPVAVTW